MFFITTKTTSKTFPKSRVVPLNEIGGRVVTSTRQIVREFTPSPPPPKNVQYWITKTTGDIYKRILTNDSYKWEYVSDIEDINRTQAVAQAWVEPPNVLHNLRLFSKVWRGESDSDANNIAWFPSLGSSTDIVITETNITDNTGVTFIKDTDIPDNEEVDMSYNVRLTTLPTYNNTPITPKGIYMFNELVPCLFTQNTKGTIEQYNGIRLNSPHRHIKFTLPEGTCLASDISHMMSGRTKTLSIKETSIVNIICKNGIDAQKIKNALNSRASDNSILTYVSDCVSKLDTIPPALWKKTTNKGMRSAITELYDPYQPMRFSDIFNYLEENHDATTIGKSRNEVFTEIKIILSVLTNLSKAGKDYPRGWL